jgi:SAM-dependent methyltransferase
MSELSLPELSTAVRESTLARFEAHRRAWHANPALRVCYGHWYRRLAEALPPRDLGEWIEIGSGPGFAREFIPDLVLTDIVQAPWHARRVSAEVLPFGDGEVGALVLFDVLHHVDAPARFFAEATRVLRPGGRILLLEPYISPLSRLVYGPFHPELVDMSVDPLAPVGGETRETRDPFLSNQATPTLIFCRGRGHRFAGMFPKLAVTRIERFVGLSYVATGGFSRRPLLPLPLWRAIFALENLLPKFVFRLFGFRVLVVIERRA